MRGNSNAVKQVNLQRPKNIALPGVNAVLYPDGKRRLLHLIKRRRWGDRCSEREASVHTGRPGQTTAIGRGCGRQGLVLIVITNCQRQARTQCPSRKNWAVLIAAT